MRFHFCRRTTFALHFHQTHPELIQQCLTSTNATIERNFPQKSATISSTISRLSTMGVAGVVENAIPNLPPQTVSFALRHIIDVVIVAVVVTTKQTVPRNVSRRRNGGSKMVDPPPATNFTKQPLPNCLHRHPTTGTKETRSGGTVLARVRGPPRAAFDLDRDHPPLLIDVWLARTTGQPHETRETKRS